MIYNNKFLILVLILICLCCGCSSKTQKEIGINNESVMSNNDAETQEMFEVESEEVVDDTVIDFKLLGMEIHLPDSYLENMDKFYITSDDAALENGFYMGQLSLLEASKDEFNNSEFSKRQQIRQNAYSASFVTLDNSKDENYINNYFMEKQTGLSAKLTQINKTDNFTYYNAVYNGNISSGIFSDENRNIAEKIINDLKDSQKNIVFKTPEDYVYSESNEEQNEQINQDDVAINKMEVEDKSIQETINNDNINTNTNLKKISFRAKDINDENVISSELFRNNKITMLNLSASWCEPCVAEKPELEKINEEIIDRGGEVVGIMLDGNTEDGLESCKEIIDDTGVTYRMIKTNEDIDKLFDNVEAIPTTYFIDSEGQIIGDAIVGAYVDGYRRRLDSLLK